MAKNHAGRAFAVGNNLVDRLLLCAARMPVDDRLDRCVFQDAGALGDFLCYRFVLVFRRVFEQLRGQLLGSFNMGLALNPGQLDLPGGAVEIGNRLVLIRMQVEALFDFLGGDAVIPPAACQAISRS